MPNEFNWNDTDGLRKAEVARVFNPRTMMPPRVPLRVRLADCWRILRGHGVMANVRLYSEDDVTVIKAVRGQLSVHGFVLGGTPQGTKLELSGDEATQPVTLWTPPVA